MGNKVRIADRINAASRYTEGDAVRLNNMFRGRDTVEMLTILLRENMLGDAAVVSSFGAESAVLLHVIASIDPTIPVLFLDTGKHFPETIIYREELQSKLGLQDLRILTLILFCSSKRTKPACGGHMTLMVAAKSAKCCR